MKKMLIVLINVVIIVVVLCNYHTNKVVANPGDDVVTSSNDVEFVDVNVTYEEQLGHKAFSEVQRAITKMPPDVVKQFAQDNWKIAIVSEVDTSGTEFETVTMPKTVGFTNMNDKTIQITPAPDDEISNFIMVKTLHELCHYADSFYGNAADSDEFKALYEDFRNSYVEFEYKSLKKTNTNREDIEYATSNRWEFFACTMKDYLNQPEYLKLNYPEIYDYYTNLIVK